MRYMFQEKYEKRQIINYPLEEMRIRDKPQQS
jgi:hypothetical protein